MLTSPAIIDWLQFTVPVTAGTGKMLAARRAGSSGWLADELMRLLMQWGMPDELAAVLSPVAMVSTGASAPYNAGMTAAGVSWYWHDASLSVDSFLCQISGQGCARLRDLNMLTPVMNYVHERVSRIDIAIDIETQAPLESLYTTTKRISYINSKSGQTFYIGSMKSDKYARIYRYAAPHPRSAYVRIECVYRRKFASEACRQVLERGVERAAIDMLASNKIVPCEALQASLGGGERLRVAPPVNTGDESTIRWMITAVVPAFRRLVTDGKIDARQFVNEYFIGDEDESSTPASIG